MLAVSLYDVPAS